MAKTELTNNIDLDSNNSSNAHSHLEDECRRLSEENAKLKEELNRLQNKDSNITAPVVIFFKNRALAIKYKDSVDKFLRQLLANENNESSQNDSCFEKGLANVPYYQEFCIDGTSSKSEVESDKWNKPIYLQAYEEILEEEKKETVEPATPTPEVQSLACFNCLGAHHMAKCPEKLDRQRIAQNRKEFQSGQRNCRYHEDDNNCKKGKPGLISEELRSALNLEHNQIPTYIYKMRILGYPPGWMKEAEVENSGINVYDSAGKSLGDESMKEKSAEPQYDQRKFVDYPGFNVSLPSHVYDEWRNLQMPPMQNHHLRSEAEKYINMINLSSYRKRKNEEDGSRTKINKEDNKDSSTVTPNRVVMKENSKNTPGSASLSISPGTPIIATDNPFNKLPDVTNFSKDIADYMPYENLPDAVGTFEKMRIVLDKVRQKLEI